MRVTDRQTDRWTDRITTPKTALAYARAVETANNDEKNNRFTNKPIESNNANYNKKVHRLSHVSQYGRTASREPPWCDGGGLSDVIACRGQSSVSWRSNMSQMSQNIRGATRCENASDVESLHIVTQRPNITDAWASGRPLRNTVKINMPQSLLYKDMQYHGSRHAHHSWHRWSLLQQCFNIKFYKQLWDQLLS